jgi:hypothetical protein
MGAAPSGRPGWPEFAFWMASAARKRMVLMQRSSSSEFIDMYLTSNCPMFCTTSLEKPAAFIKPDLAFKTTWSGTLLDSLLQ